MGHACVRMYNCSSPRGTQILYIFCFNTIISIQIAYSDNEEHKSIDQIIMEAAPKGKKKNIISKIQYDYSRISLILYPSQSYLSSAL